MGLDISIGINNFDEVFDGVYYENEDEDENDNKHNLSRTFCNFMCRKDVVEHKAELDQIGKITNVDISPIYQMESYIDVEELENYIDEEDLEEEIAKAESDNAKLEGNITLVLKTVTELIEQLNEIENLPQQLLHTDYDTLNNADYFSSFKTGKGTGYTDNNFGQDLRNFKNFLEYCLAKGTTTVWFAYN